LCTPTGAALLKYFASGFGKMPVMSISKTGYGMGKKDFEHANCVRIMIGESDEGTAEGKVAELCCNVDDMTGEEIGYATELLMKQGALDVFTTPVGMKKNRPGILITCICRPEDKEKFAKLVFENTTTIGIRYSLKDRYVLDRHEETVSTKYGDVKVKISEGFGVKKAKPGYDDVSGIADKI
ncbi:MAG: LarC family nickel insertion protein, partial [Oscillospiraceae bacterium]|nr:LarC family nickel insertion protein [Oscillospiraceae bacterium]